MSTEILSVGSVTAEAELKLHLAALLDEARSRTLALLAPVPVAELFAQQDRLMSPIIWDLGHIGNFEELWGVRPLGGSIRPEYDSLYDAMTNPRSTRDKLPLPEFERLLGFLRDVRAGLLERLNRADLGDGNPLLRDGYVYMMLLQHEYQHDETILATLQLKLGEPYHPAERRALPGGDLRVGGMVTVPAGEFWMGTDDRSAAYDNERSRHQLHLDAFQIGVAPVSNAEFMKFVEAGGYRRKELWEEAGWAFVQENGIVAPKHWEQDADGAWHTRSMDRTEPVNPRRPVVHVCWHEASAYCRFAGLRLPTEAEWEKAASWNPATGEQAIFPWGNEPFQERRANLDQLAFMAAEIGAYPDGVSAVGCHQMIGDVWEWTASDFVPYPGFQAFPYDEYSKVFFGPEYKVLRGGSWATRPGAIRNSFRNWDFPIRRQIFSGFRCARDI
ncbi:MAG: ergothioneine biosynthesis protein EgtB [Bacteroidetes bacterium]|nr:ergothioneine biosynthesis protein EgtB [Bacteroidota bacterium]